MKLFGWTESTLDLLVIDAPAKDIRNACHSMLLEINTPRSPIRSLSNDDQQAIRGVFKKLARVLDRLREAFSQESELKSTVMEGDLSPKHIAGFLSDFNDQLLECLRGIQEEVCFAEEIAAIDGYLGNLTGLIDTICEVVEVEENCEP